MKFPSYYGLLVGSLMIVQWLFTILAGGVPEFRTAPWELTFHLAAELSTAVILIVAGIATLRSVRRARGALLVGLGMVIYSEIVSPGYFAQRGQWAFVIMFAMLLAGALLAVRELVTAGSDREGGTVRSGDVQARLAG